MVNEILKNNTLVNILLLHISHTFNLAFTQNVNHRSHGSFCKYFVSFFLFFSHKVHLKENEKKIPLVLI